MKDANMLSKQHSIGSIVLTSMGKGKKIRLKEKKIVETKERKKTQRFYSKIVQNTEAHSLSYLTHDLNLSRSNQTLTHLTSPTNLPSRAVYSVTATFHSSLFLKCASNSTHSNSAFNFM